MSQSKQKFRVSWKSIPEFSGRVIPMENIPIEQADRFNSVGSQQISNDESSTVDATIPQCEEYLSPILSSQTSSNDHSIDILRDSLTSEIPQNCGQFLSPVLASQSLNTSALFPNNSSIESSNLSGMFMKNTSPSKSVSNTTVNYNKLKRTQNRFQTVPCEENFDNCFSDISDKLSQSPLPKIKKFRLNASKCKQRLKKTIVLNELNYTLEDSVNYEKRRKHTFKMPELKKNFNKENSNNTLNVFSSSDDSMILSNKKDGFKFSRIPLNDNINFSLQDGDDNSMNLVKGKCSKKFEMKINNFHLLHDSKEYDIDIDESIVLSNNNLNNAKRNVEDTEVSFFKDVSLDEDIHSNNTNGSLISCSDDDNTNKLYEFYSDSTLINGTNNFEECPDNTISNKTDDKSMLNSSVLQGRQSIDPRCMIDSCQNINKNNINHNNTYLSVNSTNHSKVSDFISCNNTTLSNSKSGLNSPMEVACNTEKSCSTYLSKTEEADKNLSDLNAPTSDDTIATSVYTSGRLSCSESEKQDTCNVTKVMPGSRIIENETEANNSEICSNISSVEETKLSDQKKQLTVASLFTDIPKIGVYNLSNSTNTSGNTVNKSMNSDTFCNNNIMALHTSDNLASTSSYSIDNEKDNNLLNLNALTSDETIVTSVYASDQLSCSESEKQDTCNVTKVMPGSRIIENETDANNSEICNNISSVEETKLSDQKKRLTVASLFTDIPKIGVYNLSNSTNTSGNTVNKSMNSDTFCNNNIMALHTSDNLASTSSYSIDNEKDNNLSNLNALTSDETIVTSVYASDQLSCTESENQDTCNVNKVMPGSGIIENETEANNSEICSNISSVEETKLSDQKKQLAVASSFTDTSKIGIYNLSNSTNTSGNTVNKSMNSDTFCNNNIMALHTSDNLASTSSYIIDNEKDNNLSNLNALTSDETIAISLYAPDRLLLNSSVLQGRQSIDPRCMIDSCQNINNNNINHNNTYLSVDSTDYSKDSDFIACNNTTLSNSKSGLNSSMEVACNTEMSCSTYLSKTDNEKDKNLSDLNAPTSDETIATSVYASGQLSCTESENQDTCNVNKVMPGSGIIENGTEANNSEICSNISSVEETKLSDQKKQLTVASSFTDTPKIGIYNLRNSTNTSGNTVNKSMNSNTFCNNNIMTLHASDNLASTSSYSIDNEKDNNLSNLNALTSDETNVISIYASCRSSCSDSEKQDNCNAGKIMSGSRIIKNETKLNNSEICSNISSVTETRLSDLKKQLAVASLFTDIPKIVSNSDTFCNNNIMPLYTSANLASTSLCSIDNEKDNNLSDLNAQTNDETISISLYTSGRLSCTESENQDTCNDDKVMFDSRIIENETESNNSEICGNVSSVEETNLSDLKKQLAVASLFTDMPKIVSNSDTFCNNNIMPLYTSANLANTSSCSINNDKDYNLSDLNAQTNDETISISLYTSGRLSCTESENKDTCNVDKVLPGSRIIENETEVSNSEISSNVNSVEETKLSDQQKQLAVASLLTDIPNIGVYNLSHSTNTSSNTVNVSISSDTFCNNNSKGNLSIEFDNNNILLMGLKKADVKINLPMQECVRAMSIVDHKINNSFQNSEQIKLLNEKEQLTTPSSLKNISNNDGCDKHITNNDSNNPNNVSSSSNSTSNMSLISDDKRELNKIEFMDLEFDNKVNSSVQQFTQPISYFDSKLNSSSVQRVTRSMSHIASDINNLSHNSVNSPLFSSNGSKSGSNPNNECLTKSEAVDNKINMSPVCISDMDSKINISSVQRITRSMSNINIHTNNLSNSSTKLPSVSNNDSKISSNLNNNCLVESRTDSNEINVLPAPKLKCSTSNADSKINISSAHIITRSRSRIDASSNINVKSLSVLSDDSETCVYSINKCLMKLETNGNRINVSPIQKLTVGDNKINISSAQMITRSMLNVEAAMDNLSYSSNKSSLVSSKNDNRNKNNSNLKSGYVVKKQIGCNLKTTKSIIQSKNLENTISEVYNDSSTLPSSLSLVAKVFGNKKTSRNSVDDEMESPDNLNNNNGLKNGKSKQKKYTNVQFPKFSPWCTKHFYQIIIRKIEKTYGIESKRKALEIVKYLSGSVSEISNLEHNYEEIVNEMKHKLAAYSIITTNYDFYYFCSHYMPPRFKHKVVPFFQPFNAPLNVSFEPSEVFKPIYVNTPFNSISNNDEL